MHDNRLEPYFPLSFRWLGFMLVPLGILGIFPAQGFTGYLWPVLSIIAGTLFIFTYYGSQIDFEQQLAREYIGFLGIKKGRWDKIPNLEKVFITKTNYSQVIWSRVSNTSERSTLFKAYLKGADDFKFLFSEKKKRAAIITAAKSVSGKLHLKILDCTVNPPVWLDSVSQHES